MQYFAAHTAHSECAMQQKLEGEKLDFRFNGKMPVKYLGSFNEIARRIQDAFTDLIEGISRENKGNLDWWVSSPASRNTFLSPLFHYCSCIALIQELILGKEPLPEIVVDTKNLKKIVEKYLADQGIKGKVVLSKRTFKQRLKELVRPFYATACIPLTQLLLLVIARRVFPLRRSLPLEPLTLIDTYAMQGYIEKDRYYPGILAPLSAKERERVWFVPHLYGFRPWQYRSVVRKLRTSERNFVLKEDFLKLRDYLFAWCHVYRVRGVKIASCLFRGVDISSLVREETRNFRTADSSYTALLNYRFFYRMQQAGMHLRLVVDWFENQIIDRGFNAGVRRFFPGTTSVGYQGFIPLGYELNVYPTATEREDAILPQEIGTIGRALTPSARCPGITVRLAPALRYQGVWEDRKYYPEKDVFTILIALPFKIDTSVEILKMLAWCAGDNELSGVRIGVKPHPTASEGMINNALLVPLPGQFEFVSGDFNECVEKSDLVVSSASDACMETLAKGTPVIVVDDSAGLFLNPIPETIAADIWRLCRTPDEIKRAILFYRNRSPEKVKAHEEIGKRIREEYFEQVTAESVRMFLGLHEKEKGETDLSPV